MPNQNKKISQQDLLNAESGTIIKRHTTPHAIALVYPNSYHLGMSNLGFQTLYSLFNKDTECACERVFLDSMKSNQPLRTFENGRLVKEVDCVAFSISFENDYLNILPLLHQTEIPYKACDRKESDPIVIAGGTAITINPEPVRPFFDILFIGEAENAISDIISVLKSNTNRSNKIAELEKIPGCYATSKINEFTENNEKISLDNPYPKTLNQKVSRSQLRQYKKATLYHLDQYPTQTTIHTPHTEFGNFSLIELQRGCEYGCKFCAECFVATPFRERSIALIKNQIHQNLKISNKIGLIGTNLLKYPDFIKLCQFIHNEGGTFSPSSLRANDITPALLEELKKSHHKTIAIAPETGAESLRQSMNKKITNDQICDVTNLISLSGFPRIKLYLMIGLPRENIKHIQELIDLIGRMQQLLINNAKKNKIHTKLILSINSFIPKPRTPYASEHFFSIQELQERLTLINKHLSKFGNVKIIHDTVSHSYLQALLANGSVNVSEFLLTLFKKNENPTRFLKKHL